MVSEKFQLFFVIEIRKKYPEKFNYQSFKGFLFEYKYYKLEIFYIMLHKAMLKNYLNS